MINFLVRLKLLWRKKMIAMLVTKKKDSQNIEFYLMKPHNKEQASFGNGTMVSFTAQSKESVINIYNLALKLGGKDEGKPGPRHEEHFYAYFRDLDGNKICIYCPD